MEDLLCKHEVFRIVGAAFEVYNTLGPGFLEAVYQEALEIELTSLGIPFDGQKELRIHYKDQILPKTYCADLECFGCILVELKAESHLHANDDAQLLNYLKASHLEVGVLLNFGARQRLEWKRLVRTRRSSHPH
jgi:GxxExxY protein